MIAAALWLCCRRAAPTVGDTIWVSRTVAVPPGRTLRAGDWHPDDPVERPRARRGSSSAAIPPASCIPSWSGAPEATWWRFPGRSSSARAEAWTPCRRSSSPCRSPVCSRVSRRLDPRPPAASRLRASGHPQPSAAADRPGGGRSCCWRRCTGGGDGVVLRPHPCSAPPPVKVTSTARAMGRRG